MPGIPLTEERFAVLFEQSIKNFITPIMSELHIIKNDVAILKNDVAILKNDVSSLKANVSLLNTQVKELKNFQDLESKAIEYELRQILYQYLKKQFPLMNVMEFKMKEMYHPITGEHITELDGAFTLGSISPDIDYKRFTDAGLSFIKIPKKEQNYPTIFVLAEAKHYLTRSKIAKKLAQFDKIISFFEAAKTYKRTKSESYTRDFVMTVLRNDFITNMHTYILFFGASFWDKNMMDNLEHDVAKRKEFIQAFHTATNTDKIRIFRKIKALEKQWYSHKDFKDQLPPDYELSDDKILELQEVRGAMAHIQFVLPSGERYRVPETEPEIKPIGTLPIGGRTLRRSRPFKSI